MSLDSIAQVVSIITVVKNDAAGLRRTLDSVAAQTHESIECIVIDGGSTDETSDVIREYSALITYSVSEIDDGVYHAMNKGIEQATGAWIHFLNAGDTFVAADSLDKLMQVHGDGLLKVGAILLGIEGDRRLEYAGFVKAGLIGTICHQAILFRRSIFCERTYDRQYRFAADFDLLVELYLDNRSTFADYSNTPFVRYEGGGISDQNAQAALEERKTIFKSRLKGVMRAANLLNVKRQILKLNS